MRASSHGDCRTASNRVAWQLRECPDAIVRRSLELLQLKSAVIRGLRSQSGKARGLTKDLTRASSSCAEATQFTTPSTTSGACSASAVSPLSLCSDISEASDHLSASARPCHTEHSFCRVASLLRAPAPSIPASKSRVKVLKQFSVTLQSTHESMDR
jgi:hypothetical protein